MQLKIKLSKTGIILSIFCLLITSCSKPNCQSKGLYVANGMIHRDPFRKFRDSEELILLPYIRTSHKIPEQLIEDTITQLNLKNSSQQKLSVQEFKENLEVRLVGGTDLFFIGYEKSSSQQKFEIINRFMVNYLEFSIKQQIVANYEFLNEVEREQIKHLAPKILQYKQEVFAVCDTVSCGIKGLRLWDFPNLKAWRQTSKLEGFYTSLINPKKKPEPVIEGLRTKFDEANSEYRQFRKENGYSQTALDVLDAMSEVEALSRQRLGPRIIKYASVSCSK